MPGFFAATLRGNAGMITKHRRNWVRRGMPAARTGSLPVRRWRGTCNAACTASRGSLTYLSDNGTARQIRVAPTPLWICIFAACGDADLRVLDAARFLGKRVSGNCLGPRPRSSADLVEL